MKSIFSYFSMILVVLVFASCGKDAENEKFFGTYIGSVDCDDDETYPTTIMISAKGDSKTEVNFVIDSDDDTTTLTGKVSGSTLTLNKTEIEEETFISGNGTLVGNTLTCSFIIEESPDSFTCIFIGTK
ncbi:MAG: hypothetical protein R2774_08065 [Saprospiraceae bacterium]